MYYASQYLSRPLGSTLDDPKYFLATPWMIQDVDVVDGKECYVSLWAWPSNFDQSQLLNNHIFSTSILTTTVLARIIRTNTSFEHLFPHLLRIILCSCFPTLVFRATSLFLWDPCSCGRVVQSWSFFRQAASSVSVILFSCLGSSLAVAFPLETPFRQPTILYCEVLLCGCGFDANFYADIFHPLLLVPAYFSKEFLSYNCGYSISMSLNSLH